MSEVISQNISFCVLNSLQIKFESDPLDLSLISWIFIDYLDIKKEIQIYQN